MSFCVPVTTISRASIDAASEILDIQKRAFLSEAAIYNDYSIEPLTQSLIEFVSEFDSRIFLKAVHNSKITGSVSIKRKGGTLYIGRLIVDPKYQGQGIGKKLLEAAEKYYSGIKRYELFTGSKSHRNIYIYKKAGYRIFKTKKANDRIWMVFMEKLN